MTISSASRASAAATIARAAGPSSSDVSRTAPSSFASSSASSSCGLAHHDDRVIGMPEQRVGDAAQRGGEASHAARAHDDLFGIGFPSEIGQAHCRGAVDHPRLGVHTGLSRQPIDELLAGGAAFVVQFAHGPRDRIRQRGHHVRHDQASALTGPARGMLERNAGAERTVHADEDAREGESSLANVGASDQSSRVAR
jgi:hypothetical protein